MYVHVCAVAYGVFDWCDVAQPRVTIVYVPRVTIAMLPDVALLEVFDFYVHGTPGMSTVWHTSKSANKTWYKLVHVCRKWRNVIFGSPVRLDLRLYCTVGTPVM